MPPMLQELRLPAPLDLLESAPTSLGNASNQIGGASEQVLQRLDRGKQKQAGAGQTELEPDGTKDEFREVGMAGSPWCACGLSDQLGGQRVPMWLKCSGSARCSPRPADQRKAIG
ncbi:perilipin-3 [Lates japonicus]|uniref:Perilipin-3 n=1 Tax=Lates japonicus TaxID=270547 RepID=A0AAD3R9M1_LATJO|nr:perilipin-3 [Lates japonicus]